ncbi:MAG: hypothetical protein JWN48_4037 [Myxococcaceae bacterium]|nr:hypothetical protein [Myxococcaceae bacterium]
MGKYSWFATGSLALCLTLGALWGGGCVDDDGLSGQSGDLKHAGRGAAKPGDAALPSPTDAASEVDPCKLAACSDDQRCELMQVQCIRAPCRPIASCVAREPVEVDAGVSAPSCAAVLCRAGTTCVEGPNGATCVEPSVDGCKDQKCDVGTHCELEVVQCFAAPCPPIPSCAPDVDVCATVRCSAGTHCEAKHVQCIRAPCPPIASCIAD